MSAFVRSRWLARVFPSLGVEHLWVMAVLTLVGVFIALVPTVPHDFWWHLKAGELVFEGGIPRTNLFAWTLPVDHPYTYATWLGEWLFYVCYRFGGFAGPVLVRNVLGVGGFVLVACEARRRSGSWRLAALAVLLAALMTINNLTTRTQNWAWVPFGGFVLVLGAYVGGGMRARVLFVLPVLMAFWVNVHGSFVLGFVLVGLVAVGETLRCVLRLPGALVWGRVLWLYGVGVAVVLAMLCNPSGVGIFGYVANLLSNTTSQGLVNEWQPPTPHGIAGVCFFASILGLVVAVWLARRRLTPTDLLVVCAFLWLAWGGQRFVVWYGMVAMPMLVQCLARSPGVRSVRVAVPAFLVWVPMGLFLVILVAVQPPLKARLALPLPYRSLFVELPGAPQLFSADTPVGATAYLRAHPIEGRLFNEMGYGSYLDWALYPVGQVFIDTRVELYPLTLWQDYVAISEAYGYRQLLVERYGVERVLLDRLRQPRLAAALASDPLWVREYADGRAEIYRRKR